MLFKVGHTYHLTKLDAEGDVVDTFDIEITGVSVTKISFTDNETGDTYERNTEDVSEHWRKIGFDIEDVTKPKEEEDGSEDSHA